MNITNFPTEIHQPVLLQLTGSTLRYCGIVNGTAQERNAPTAPCHGMHADQVKFTTRGGGKFNSQVFDEWYAPYYTNEEIQCFKNDNGSCTGGCVWNGDSVNNTQVGSAFYRGSKYGCTPAQNKFCVYSWFSGMSCNNVD